MESWDGKNNMLKAQDYIVRYLDEARLMQVATQSGDQPWCCTVYFAHDNLNNLYWISLPDARHSRDIQQNAKVAGTVVLPHAYGDPVQGLQFEGTARAVFDDDEIRRMTVAYSERFNYPTLANDIISGKNAHYLYQITPEQFVLFDTLHFPTDPRQTWRLSTQTA